MLLQAMQATRCTSQRLQAQFIERIYCHIHAAEGSDTSGYMYIVIVYTIYHTHVHLCDSRLVLLLAALHERPGVLEVPVGVEAAVPCLADRSRFLALVSLP